MDEASSLLLRSRLFWQRNFVSIAFPTFVITAIFLDYRRTQRYKKLKAEKSA